LTSRAAQGAPPWRNTGAGERPTGKNGNPPSPYGSPLSWPPAAAPACSRPRSPGSSLARLTGLAAAAALGWRLWFRPSSDTLAWRRGAQGEQRTARLLAPLERHGYQVFHDLAIPGSAANVDHLVVGPTGLFVIDSKRYRGHLHYSAGRLWHGRRPLDRTLETLWWEATQVAETLGFGPDLHVYPVLCVHVARLPWLRELLVDGIPVLAAGTLRPALRVIRQALSPEQVELVAAQVRAGFQPAA
jgi:nuclease-like protein